jgi:hypothetical protein
MTGFTKTPRPRVYPVMPMKLIPMKFGGYQPPASIHNQAARSFGDLLEQELGNPALRRGVERGRPTLGRRCSRAA